MVLPSRHRGKSNGRYGYRLFKYGPKQKPQPAKVTLRVVVSHVRYIVILEVTGLKRSSSRVAFSFI
jgi:hypothetical protein